MPRPLDEDEEFTTQPDIEELEDPGERIERRNSNINRRLEQSLEALERRLEGAKSGELPPSEEVKAKRILNGAGKDEPILKEEVMRSGGDIPDMDADNYRDYWRLVNNHLNTDETSNCLYLMAGEDLTPALEIDGEWTFLGLGYENNSTVVNGEEIQLVNHDISNGMPFEDRYDFAVVKSPGAGNVDGELGELGELGVERAYETLSENGVLVTDQEYEGRFDFQENVEPSPIAYLRRVSTENGAAYNTDQLRILYKD